MYMPSLASATGTVEGSAGSGLFSDDKPGIDLSGLVLFLRRRWKLIVSTAIIVAILTALVLLQTTPRYSAVASVAVQTQRTQVVDIKDVMSGLSPDQATMETQASILRSSRLTGMMIDKLHLDQEAEFNPQVAKSARGFSLFDPAGWFEAPTPRGAALSPAQQAASQARVIERVTRALDIRPAAKSYVLSITATASRPQLAVQMADTLADLYITDGIAAKYEATRKASNYLQQRVDELRAQTVATDHAAEGYRAQAGLIGSEQGSTVAGQQLSEINTQLVTARAERAAKEAQLQQIQRLRQGGGDGGIEASAAILDSALIQRLREQESEVVRKLGELRATYGERHPKIINAEAELRDLRSKIGDEVSKVAASTANELAIARARENTLAGSLARVESQVSAGNGASVKLRELQRESDANRSIYEVFLNRLKETNQQAELQQADARIVSTAELPLSPSFPKTGPTLAAALLLGLLGGVVLAYALERLDNTVRSANLLEAIGGGATLAFMPTVQAHTAKPEDVVFDRPGSMVPEALRTLRSSLALADVDNPPKVVMLSSSVPGEGKTFTSVGLARVSAQAGMRTVLIDCDMRHPRGHKAMGMSNDVGLVQVLSGQATFDEAAQYEEASGLTFVAAGKGAVNPPDMLRSEQMAKLMQRLRDEYDFVVIDSPPFAPLTDSQIMARLADKMILVVRWGETPLPVVQTTIKQLRRIGAPFAGSVLSQVNVKRHARYGFGDYGYHYSKYGAYYGAAR